MTINYNECELVPEHINGQLLYWTVRYISTKRFVGILESLENEYHFTDVFGQLAVELSMADMQEHIHSSYCEVSETRH